MVTVSSTAQLYHDNALMHSAPQGPSSSLSPHHLHISSPKSGFNECVPLVIATLPSHSLTTTLCCYVLYRFMVLTSMGMSATCITSMLLGLFMCFLVVLYQKLGRDPRSV